MNRSTFSVLFYVNKGKVKNGIAPVMGRITINGTQSQFSCKRSIPLTMWDVKGNCAKGRSKEALDLNRDLDNIKAQIIKHYQHLSDRDAFVTAEMVRNTYQGFGSKYETLLGAFDKDLAKLKRRVGKDRALGTYKLQLRSRNYVANFLQMCHRRSDISMQELTADFIKEFSVYLSNDRGLASSTIWLSYYRSLIAQGEDFQENITQLLKEQEKAREVIAEAEQAKKDLTSIKAEAKTEELKKSATKTATTALNGLNSLLGGNKVNRLEKENKELRNEVEELKEQIERLHADMQKMKDSHTREMNRVNEQHLQEFTSLKRILDKAYQWFPSFKRFLNMERECLQYGFNKEQTDKLMHGHPITYSGWLHSNEYRRKALADNVSVQVIRDEKRNLFLHINQTPIAQWFKEQFGIGQEQRKGIKI